jgi:hypothetical protein
MRRRLQNAARLYRLWIPHCGTRRIVVGSAQRVAVCDPSSGATGGVPARVNMAQKTRTKLAKQSTKYQFVDLKSLSQS